MIKRKLEMTFKNQASKNSKISLDNPRETVTNVEVKAAMENIVAMDVFDTGDGGLVELVSAKIISTEVQELELA